MSKDFSYVAKAFLQNTSSNPGIIVIKCLSVCAFLGLAYIVFGIFSVFLPKLVAMLLLLGLIYWLIVVTCRVFTFPGAYSFWRRYVENYFQKAFVKKVQRSVFLLKNLMDHLLKEVAWDHYISEEELVQIRVMISSVLNLFKNQNEHGTLTKRQRILLKDFNEIGHLLNDTDIINRADQKSFSLWSFLEENSEGQDGLELPNALLYFRDRTEGHILLDKCQKLEDRLNDITAKKGLFGGIKRWLFEDSFGTIHQVREEIANRYECKQLYLQVEKNAKLDCIFIAGRNTEEPSEQAGAERKSVGDTTEGDSNYYLEFASKGNKHLKTTVILCCPNTTYYEFLYYENEWIDIYVRNGLNVFLWNYRGYGRSTGKPDMDALKRDGEFIVDYLRKEMGVQRLGLHGESIGGIVAAHVAKAKNANFLCLDRNFASLSKIGELFYGKMLTTFYNYITLQSEEICADYLDTNCYKLITFDAKDEAVPLVGSMKYELTSKFIAQRLNVEEEYNNPIPPTTLKPIAFFKKLKKLIAFNAYNRKVEAKLEDYYGLLSKEQMLALFWAFSRISELFIPLSSLQNLPSTKKSKRSQSITHVPDKEDEGSPKPKKLARRGSLDSSMVNTSVLKDMDHNHTADDGNQSNRRKGTDESGMFNDSKFLNETIDMRGLGQLDDAFLAKTIKRKSYGSLFNEDAKSSVDVVNLLVKVFATFEGLEAGGVHISDVMALDEKDRFNVFKHFIYSFEIWGSYQPLNKIVEDEPKSLAYYHNNALLKLKEFTKKIDHTINKQKQKSIGRAQTKLVSSILDDLEVITSVIPSLYQKLSVKFGGSSSPTGDSGLNVTGQEDVQIDIENAKQTREAEGRKFIALKGETTRTVGGLATMGYLGSLLPTTYGHTGSLKQQEIEVFEYHLRNAKMIF